MMHQKTLLLLSVLLAWAVVCVAQNPHPYFRNYTTGHGLPSSEIHYCLEDSQGIIWFATDNGLSRFNGYEFRHFGPRDGLQDPVVFFMQLDSQNRIWMATLSGRLFFAEGDSIHAFTGNEVVDSVMAKGSSIGGFRINKNDDKYLILKGLGILKFKTDGSHQLFQALNPMGAAFFLEEEDELLFSSTRCPDSLQEDYARQYRSKGVFTQLEWHGKNVGTVSGQLKDANRSSAVWALRLQSGNVLMFRGNYLVELAGKRIIWQKEVDYNIESKSIFQLPNGEFLVGLQNGKGLRRYRSLEAWKAEDFQTMLPGKTISHVFQDSRGGFWVGTIEHGVFYCPDFGRKIFDASAGLPMDYVAAIAFGRAGELFVGMRNADVFRLDTASNFFEKLPLLPGPRTLYDLAFDQDEGTLWATNGRVNCYQNESWQQLRHFSATTRSPTYVIGKRLTLRPGTGRLWGASNSNFGYVDVRQKSFSLNAFDLGLRGRTLVVWEAADGRAWLGQPEGLFEYRDSQLLRPQPFHPEFETRVDDLAELAGGTLVIATKGQGLLLWRDTFFQQLTEDDGLISNMLENVHVDEQGRIWAGSLQGLSRVTFTPRAVSALSANSSEGKTAIENFTIWHGLPSNEITMVRSLGNDVWVATTRGLMQWREPGKKTGIEPPFFEAMEINGEPVQMADGADFSHRENSLTFRFLTLNYDQAGNIPYHYRLSGGRWRVTQERFVNFSNLAPGTYRFEVQSQNEDGVWSEPLVKDFVIRPPWWQHWWFFFAVAMAAGGAVLGIYKYRTGILKNEFALQNQVTELEKKALQAQMNPHFIFNCLNSIRRLILDQEGANAVTYLTHFSKLIRSNLQVSIAGLITLQEEIEMLKNYLELEKLRFKDAFNYSLEVEKSIDQFDVVLPPLLIQPYVENAVVHGMRARESGGQISVSFCLEGNHLLATITDNGPGINQTRQSDPFHKSVGMTLTKRRLELLNDQNPDDLVKVSEVLSAKGDVNGTRVEVWISQPA